MHTRGLEDLNLWSHFIVQPHCYLAVYTQISSFSQIFVWSRDMIAAEITFDEPACYVRTPCSAIITLPSTQRLSCNIPPLHTHSSIAIMDKEPSIPPLDKERFNKSFEHFCLVKQLVRDRGLLHVGGKDVNLHFLHAAVMKHQEYDIDRVRRRSLPSRPSTTLNVKYSARA